MFKTICIIGLGTLGGFLAKELSELENIKKLILIDYDKVEIKNLKNSIYKKDDIEQLKTEAIIKKLNNEIEIITINEKFIEDKTKLPNCDLVIDCRDFTYDRSSIIDVRLYISLRNLIIDCRKNIKYPIHHEGKYIDRLTKTDFRNAAFHSSILINSGLINDLIKNQSVQEIDLDYILNRTKNIVTKLNEKQDILYDYNSKEKKLLNLHKNLLPIINTNKNFDISVYVGNKEAPYNSKIIHKNQFKSINDVISNFTSLTESLPFQFNYYVITLKQENKNYYVELVPETGAA